MRARTLIVTLAAAGLLAGCSSDKAELVDPNVAPVNYKKEILDTLTKTLTDPTNVRDAYISPLALVAIGNDKRYALCVRYNARDGAKRYMGSTDRIAYFYAGHLNQLVEATPEQCGKAAYQPFPELEKLCQAAKCA